jgi:hypothetical protein
VADRKQTRVATACAVGDCAWSFAIEERHAAAFLREVPCGRRTDDASANHDDVALTRDKRLRK